MKFFSAALLAFLFLITYDGAIRKWVLPGNQKLVFVAKDALLIGLLVLTILSVHYPKGRASVPMVVTLALGAYAAWVLIECFNPHLPNFAVAAWGVKSHLLYAGLIFLVPLAVARLRDLLHVLVKLYPLIAIPVCVIAIAQVFAPIDSILNRQIYDNPEMIAIFGEANLIRVSGTFSYITGMASFQIVLAFFGIGLYLAGARSILFLIALAIVSASFPVTGSRGVIVTVAAGSFIMIMASFSVGLMSARTALSGLAIGIALGLVSLFVTDTAWQALLERTAATTYDNKDRLITTFANGFDFIKIAGIAGFGSGAANFGAPALAPDVPPFSWLPDVGFEEESGRIVLELGWFGAILSFVMRIVLLGWAVVLLFKRTSREVRFAAVIALPFMAFGVYKGHGAFAATYLATAYWFCVAMLAMAQAESERHFARCSKLTRQSALSL